MEIWKPVAGFEGYYEVSNRGRVRSLPRTVKSKGGGVCKLSGGFLKPKARTGGYLDVTLSKDGTGRIVRIHRLVATAFLPNPDNLPQVNHKNEIRTDNRSENLEWCTAGYNNSYGHHAENVRKSLGKPVLAIFPDGRRQRFPSIAEAQRTLGVYNVWLCVNGKQKTAGGAIWQFAPAE